MNMATSFRVDGMVIGSQKRKRAWTVMRRMLATEVTSPKGSEFTAVLMEAKVTWLKTLFAVKRRSRLRDSLMGIERLMLMFKIMLPGPSMVFRPASPKVEPTGFTQ